MILSDVLGCETREVLREPARSAAGQAAAGGDEEVVDAQDLGTNRSQPPPELLVLGDRAVAAPADLQPASGQQAEVRPVHVAMAQGVAA